MNQNQLQNAAAGFAQRYLSRYRTHVKRLSNQPLVASALWVPGLRDRPFLGVSQWVERILDPQVMAALDSVGPLTTHHGMCAEPVSISKALRHSGGDAGALEGGICVAVRIELSGSRSRSSGSFNLGSPTFGFRPTFGDIKPACPSCQGLLAKFGIIEG